MTQAGPRHQQAAPVSPVDLYGDSLVRRCSTRLRYADGHVVPLNVPRWVSVSVAGDDDLLARCRSATLDVGCGPGRLIHALLASGIACTGVDVAPVAVQLARASGAEVLHASVYDPVLDGTRWSTVLLADGNIGIEGNPIRLLRRAGELLQPGGVVVAEFGRPGTGSKHVRMRLEAGDRASSWFSWAHVAADDASEVAREAGLQVVEAWRAGGRHFASLALVRPVTPLEPR